MESQQGSTIDHRCTQTSHVANQNGNKQSAVRWGSGYLGVHPVARQKQHKEDVDLMLRV
jgi:hypothetical protein